MNFLLQLQELIAHVELQIDSRCSNNCADDRCRDAELLPVHRFHPRGLSFFWLDGGLTYIGASSRHAATCRGLFLDHGHLSGLGVTLSIFRQVQLAGRQFHRKPLDAVALHKVGVEEFPVEPSFQPN